ncbi:polysaccharide biosynthesis protein [Entomobacter blattae]|uniref:UDP-N-acetyl-alpha-D-glucosamine C6 dehydratase n=1 Tax=Entomobacter blattae TaxID=2762277 RepID=A0A7H1NRZ1_9PROT|nr:nucleoside-diphosphate sugar epimerase/dehydratase [Entomobacter blattae]QNT78551.1 UDP-N-acetyl-alpha-D-glucosamine C6 dehydratase [Entomobacter blattae]
MNRIFVNVLIDGLLAAIAAPLARWLAVPQEGLLHPLWFLAGGVISLSMGGLPFRIFQQYWRFSGVADLLGIAGASTASAFLFMVGLWVTGFSLPSPTFPIIHALVLLVLMGGIRLLYRLLHGWAPGQRKNYRKAILVGSETTVELFARSLLRLRNIPIRVTGIFTLSRHQTGRRIHGFPIIGPVEDIAVLFKRLAEKGRLPDLLIVTDNGFRGHGLMALIHGAEQWDVPVERVPDMTELSPASTVELRPIALEELLNRPPVELDRQGMDQMIRGQVVLVTGAGGSIGSELVRQIASLSPGLLVLLDNNEYALWRIDVELGETQPEVPRKIVMADVRDRLRIDRVFVQYRPAFVFHAAALKHVPMVEANPLEGLCTNIVGTKIIADSCRKWHSAAMVLVSTDKAVNPSSLMGASKRVAEMYCQALDIMARVGDPAGLPCVTVRFGNVLGSTGSVVPLFRRQLSKGGPLTVTHPDMQRYFMTVPEAVELVLQASVRAIVRNVEDDDTDKNLKKGGIFVLDMGKAIRIEDLARQMIRLAGLKPDEDIAIRYTGLRPGEKLFEELFHGSEPILETDHPGLKIALPRKAQYEEVNRIIEDIHLACQEGATERAMSYVRALVPEFVHNAQGILVDVDTGLLKDAVSDPTAEKGVADHVAIIPELDFEQDTEHDTGLDSELNSEQGIGLDIGLDSGQGAGQEEVISVTGTLHRRG